MAELLWDVSAHRFPPLPTAVSAQMNFCLKRLSTLKEAVEDSEDFVSLEIDSHRNQARGTFYWTVPHTPPCKRRVLGGRFAGNPSGRGSPSAHSPLPHLAWPSSQLFKLDLLISVGSFALGIFMASPSSRSHHPAGLGPLGRYRRLD